MLTELMPPILPTLLTGLAGASSLFLVAAGLTVVFGVTRVVNFAHGSLFMLGAYVGWSLLTRLPAGPGFFVLGVVGAALAVAALGVALEVGLLRRIYRAPELFQLLATFGVVLMVQDAVLLLWGPEDLALPRPRWLRATVPLGDGRFPVFDLVLIGLGPLVLLGLHLLFGRTRWGASVRAAAEDRHLVAALGVNARLLYTAVFALGAGLAGLGGALSLPGGSAHGGIDLAVVTDAFVVVVVGGLGSVPGAFLAALLIGLAQSFGLALLPQAAPVLVFALMAAVLAVRPQGLLGRTVPAVPVRGEAVLRPAGARGRAAMVGAVAVAAVLPFVLGPFGVGVLTEALILVLFAAGLHLMMGPGGMASFGHAAFFGIGAYATGLLAREAGAPLAVALAAAPVAAGAAAGLFGLLVVRLSGVYLAMLTLAFAQIAWASAVQFVGVTGGDNGVLGVWPGLSPPVFCSLVLVLVAGGVLFYRRAIFAPFGYALRAARDDGRRAEALGLPVRRLRLLAVVLAGAGAGLAGGLFAYAKGGVFPSYLAIGKSVDALVMVLLGGVGTVSGPVVGALAYVGLYDLLLRFVPYWRFGLGAAIVALVVLFPAGLAGAWGRKR